MSDNFNNDMNNVQDVVQNNDYKKEKAIKLSDAVGGLSEKTVSDTDRKRKPVSEASASAWTAGIWRAKKIWIPAVSAAACCAIVLGVVFGSGLTRDDISVGGNGENDHNLNYSEQNPSDTSLPYYNDNFSGDGSSAMGSVSDDGFGSDPDKDFVDKNNGGTGESGNGDDKNGGSGLDDEIEEPAETELPSVGNTSEITYNVQKPGMLDMSRYVEVLGRAEYPDTAVYPTADVIRQYQENGMTGEANDLYNKWFDSWIEQREEKLSYDNLLDHDALSDFNKATSSALLSGSGGENRVYSPANIYLTLSVLAEITDGSSREQLLKLAGFDNIEELREQAAALWKNLYSFDGINDTVLANSLWLNSGLEADNDTVNRIAEEYFASVFRGDMSKEETLTAMKKWLNDQTGGLLEDSVNSLSLPPETLMTLCSTVYFHAKWYEEFDPLQNDFKTFHGYNGDKQAEFMNITNWGDTYFWGEDYGAARLSYDRAGHMWFILPDEDKSIDDVLESGEFLDMLVNSDEWENQSDNDINFSVPKFDVASDIDLKEGLKSLGVEDIFDSGEADFSPLLKDTEGVLIDKAEHAARVTIDEEGCTAAAYSVMVGGMGGPPDYEDVEFVLDRPFLFVVTGDTGNVIFVGTVYDVG